MPSATWREAGGVVRSHRSGPAIAAPGAWPLVPFNLSWYHVSVALNIKDPETERLAAEVAALTGRRRPGPSGMPCARSSRRNLMRPSASGKNA